MRLSDLQEVEIGDLSTWPIALRWIAIGVLSVGLLYGGYSFFILPEQQLLVQLQRDEIDLRDAFKIKKARVINLPAYREQVVQIQDRFGVILKQLPDKTEVPALLTDISQAGLGRGLVFRQFKPAPPEASEFYITLPISIDVSGSYHQLAEFISDLAALPRIVKLGDMSIKSAGDDDAPLTMSAELHTYQYLDEDVESATN